MLQLIVVGKLSFPRPFCDPIDRLLLNTGGFYGAERTLLELDVSVRPSEGLPGRCTQSAFW